jgi:hypothetical protein
VTTVENDLKETTMKRTWRNIVVVLSIMALMNAADVLTQERKVEEAKPVADARQLLLAAYPEVREGRVDWRFKTTETGFVVEARRIEAPFDRTLGRRPALVSGALTLDENGDLQSLVAGGTLLDLVREKAEKIAATRAGDISGALKADGAKYSPDDPGSAANLIPPGIKTVLATPIVREGVFRSEAPSDRESEKLTWQVDVESASPAGKAFSIVLEPIEGRLMSIVRR